LAQAAVSAPSTLLVSALGPAMAVNGVTLRIHVARATHLPAVSSFFGGSSVYVSVSVDGSNACRSAAVEQAPSGVAHWDFRPELHDLQDTGQLQFEVNRVGLFGSASRLGSCALAVATISVLDNQLLPLWDASETEIGRLQVSIHKEVRLPTSIQPVRPLGQPTWAAPCSSTHTARGSYSMQPSESRLVGGLTNYATQGSGCPMEAPLSSRAGAVSGGLVNHSTPDAPSASRSSIGLANHAAPAEDGTQPNALPRAQELLMELSALHAGSPEHHQKLAQAVEHLRRAPSASLRSAAGQAALRACGGHIEASFEAALARGREPDVGVALSLAGRLPWPGTDSSDPHCDTLQDALKRKWDAWKMEEALQLAQHQLRAAALGGEALEGILEGIMDQLDLAEFHARLAGRDPQRQTEAILKQLQPKLQAHLQSLLKARQWDKVESAIGVIGAARVHSLHLRGVQQELQRKQVLDLLRNALSPLKDQVGFPELKRRQLRHAVMTARTAMQEDGSGHTAAAVKQLLLGELLHQCMHDSRELAGWVLWAAFELHIPDAEVWKAAQGVFGRLPDGHKRELAGVLPGICRQMGREPPGWLLSPEQLACQKAIRAALGRPDAGALRAACQRVLETEAAQEVCREEMRQAVVRLRDEYQLPAGWDVEAMIGTSEQKLLAKNEVRDAALLGLFDRLLKETAQPMIRTRDRRGSVPQSFSVVRAVQVMNGPVWKSYVGRRGEIAARCRRAGVRHDLRHWGEALNGPVMSMDVVRAGSSLLSGVPPLVAEANEVWLLHGTSHAAAEGITSDDFDMTRASPSGLFGAGVYFAESSSKSDEYVEAGGGGDLFPVLLCRVCLGHVFYCDERWPDRRQLERRCLRDQWDSVLGDRKKTSGTFREFVIYDSLQAFPAYIIYYRRHF